MVSMILFYIPFIALFAYGIRVSGRMQVHARQPATLVRYAFMALLANDLLSLLLNLALMQSDSARHFLRYVSQLFYVINLSASAALVWGVLGWRSTPRPEGSRPVTWVSVAITLKLVGFGISMYMQRAFASGDRSIYTYMSFFQIIMSVLHLSAFILLLRAAFAWRGYPDSVPLPFDALRKFTTPPAPAEGTPAAGSPATPTPPAAAGMFEEVDYIPFVVGVMGLGGFIFVPLIWGNFSGIPFGPAVISALISCGIFAYSHGKRGEFYWGRYIALMLFFMFSVFKAQVTIHGNGRPMFMAGGIVGYIVMMGCGWAGIWIGRKLR